MNSGLNHLIKRIFLWTATILVVFSVILFVYITVVLSSGLPTLEELENPRPDLATQIFSSDGVLLDMFATTRRTWIPYDSIPAPFINALITTEDRQFRSHWGVHTMRIAKAAVKNILSMRAREGASTITQQLARNLYFTHEISLMRKIREAYTAFQIERTYTKNEILEMYSNTVNYGRGAYGIQVAAQIYFNKQPAQLTVAECAYLVGLFKAPNYYGRVDSAGLGRRNLILAMMKDEGYVGQDDYATAIAEPLRRPERRDVMRGIAPHFVEHIRQLLSRDDMAMNILKGYDLYRDGLIIHTTLQAGVQRAANDAVEEHLEEYQRLFDKHWKWSGRNDLTESILRKAIASHPDYLNANTESKTKEVTRRLRSNITFVDSIKRVATRIQCGVVVLNPYNGAVIALVGASPQAMNLDRAARYSLNHVTQIRRQPGSAFKPFVYAMALEHGLDPESTIDGGPFTYELPDGQVWAPAGASRHGGPMTLRAGLKFSTNTVAARLITEITSPSEVVRLCQSAGIMSPLHTVPSIALGAVEVSPLELSAAFGIFVNDGMYVRPAFITRIEDRHGNVIYESRLPVEASDVVSVATARSMVSMLRGVVDGGTASGIRRFYAHEAAGKTGTTNDYADAWFVGFTPGLLAGVWVGFDDRRVQFTGDYGQGGRAAAPIWGRMMQKVYANTALGYTRARFGMDRDSTDLITPDLLANPPVETMRDTSSAASRHPIKESFE